MSFENQEPAAFQAPAPTQPQTTTNAFAVTSMVMGILNFVVLFGLGAILALVFGYIAKSQIKKSGNTQEGSGMATAGIVLGYIGLALCLLLAVGAIIFLIAFPDMINEIESIEMTTY